MTPLRHRTTKSLALWLGAVAFMLQALLPLCAASPAGAEGAGGSTMIICTSHGFETIRLDGDGKPIPASPSQQHKSHCDLCVMCAAGHAVAVAESAVPSFEFLRDAVPSARTPALLSRLYASYSGRAPPESSLSNNA